MPRKKAPADLTTEIQVKPVGASLYELENEYHALLESEGNVSAEAQEEYNSLVRRTITENRLKRDRMGGFICHCNAMVDSAKTEIDRLTKRKQFYENAQNRAKRLIQETILSLGKDDRGDYRRLEGELHTLRLQGTADKVEITDEQAVPLQYKKVTVCLSAEDWQKLIAENPWLQVDTITRSVKYETSKTLLKQDLENNIEVPGADLLMNQVSVRVD